MKYRFGLLEDQGWLTVEPEGLRVRCRAELPGSVRGLYKVYLTGGGRFLLGALIPEGGALRLSRTVSLDQLKRQGVWPPEGAAAELAFSPEEGRTPNGWVRESAPARLLGEPLLARCAQGLRGVLLRRRAGGFSLAVPWRAGEEFPLPPLFCLAHAERLGGRGYAVFSFTGQGCPVVPAGEGKEWVPAGEKKTGNPSGLPEKSQDAVP